MLREHKPPPNTAIRRIRISDFGLLDPKRDPDRHQNCITWSLSHALPLEKILSKSVNKFASNPTDRQTNGQTDRTKNITSFIGGGNEMHRQQNCPLRLDICVNTVKMQDVICLDHWILTLNGFDWAVCESREKQISNATD